MNREETIEVLRWLKQSYPKYYAGKTGDFYERIITEWQKYFYEADFNHVMGGVKIYRESHSKTHPKPQDVLVGSVAMKNIERLIELVRRENNV